jgi:chemotaxis protein MotB
MAPRKRESKPPASGASWMDSFTDLLFLLVAFFVMLFSFSTMDAARWEALVTAFTGTIPVTHTTAITPDLLLAHPVPDPVGVMEIRGGVPLDEEAADMTVDLGEVIGLDELFALVELISNVLFEEGIYADVVYNPTELSIRIVFADDGDRVFFETASDVIRPEMYHALDVMTNIFEHIQGRFVRIVVEGHTDPRPPHPYQWPSNWELSVARAMSVGNYLRATGRVDETRLTVTGFGEHMPIAENFYPDGSNDYAGMERNRRVEFLIETRGVQRGDPYRGLDY